MDVTYLDDPRVVAKSPFDLTTEAKVIVAGLVGSVSHNTHLPPVEGGSDDIDILGVVLPPVANILGLNGWEHWVAIIDELDVTLFSLKKTVGLLLKANPNILGLLWLRDEHYLVRSPEFDRLRDLRSDFASVRVADAFGGYAMSQLRDIHKNVYEGYMGTKRRALVDAFGYDIKHAAHLIRLLRMAVEFMKTGELNVYRTYDADELRSIKRGEWDLDRVQMLAANLFHELDGLTETSTLPREPNRARVNAFLIDVTRNWIRA